MEIRFGRQWERFCFAGSIYPDQSSCASLRFPWNIGEIAARRNIETGHTTVSAHQYALEKAEKAAAALKQEINTLHQLTEQYSKTLQARLDNETKVKRLLVHLRNNIFVKYNFYLSAEPLPKPSRR